jgi:hypothetical protein
LSIPRCSLSKNSMGTKTKSDWIQCTRDDLLGKYEKRSSRMTGRCVNNRGTEGSNVGHDAVFDDDDKKENGGGKAKHRV